MNNNSDTLVPIADLITDTYKRLINSSVSDKERYTGLKTGFDKLDQLTEQLHFLILFFEIMRDLNSYTERRI